MSAAGIEVRLNVAEVHLEQPERLCAVEHREDAVIAGHSTQLLCRHEVADRIGQMCEGHDLCPRREGTRKGVDVVLGSGVRVLLLDHSYREAEAFGFFSPRLVVARVVVAENYDLVTGLQIEPV